jgi:hypothetical protein
VASEKRTSFVPCSSLTPSPPPFFGSADSKGLTLRNCVSVDSDGFKVLCFLCESWNLVSADSKRVKVVCFDTDSRVRGSVDSAGFSGEWRVASDPVRSPDVPLGPPSPRGFAQEYDSM